MGRPPLPQDVVEEIEKLWAKDTKQSTKEVWEIYNESPLKQRLDVSGSADEAAVLEVYVNVSLRKVQQIIRQAKERGAGKFDPKEWHPWNAGEESAEDTDFLLSLQLLNLDAEKRRLYVHEAKWARKLRVRVDTALFPIQLRLVLLYGQREFTARVFNRHAATSDLDDMIMFSPWESRFSWDKYEEAIRVGMIERPELSIAFGFDPDTLDMDILMFGTDALLMHFYLAVLRSLPFTVHDSDGVPPMPSFADPRDTTPLTQDNIYRIKSANVGMKPEYKKEILEFVLPPSPDEKEAPGENPMLGVESS